MCAEKLEDRKTLIVGMGVSGLSCARFLRQQEEVFRWVDSRDEPPLLSEIEKEFAECELYTGGFETGLLDGIATLIVSPGVALAHPFVQAAVQRGIEVLGDIELFARHARAPVVAITGSNGKSTVTELLGWVMRAAGFKVAVGGNIGTAALDLLQGPQPDVYVLELSSFQLETTTSLQAKVATVLNVTDDHMDRYENMASYAASKARIFRNAECCVLNKDDAIVMSMVAAGKSKKVLFTARHPQENEFGLVDHANNTWLALGPKRLLPCNELKILGRHNAVNALSVLALAHSLGLELEPLLSALRDFKGLPHRCEYVAEKNGVRWINDSKATNVGAAQAAIQSMPGPLIWIAGGDGKGADFSPLNSVIHDRVKQAILLGKDAERLQEAVQSEVSCHRAASLDEAVAFAAKQAESGDTVLLAPACSSLDMFENYIKRGEAFSACVYKELSQ